MGPQQRAWLSSELRAAREANQRVLVGCHLPTNPKSCFPTCLLWDFEEVLDIVESEGNGIVALYLAGHQVIIIIKIIIIIIIKKSS